MRLSGMPKEPKKNPNIALPAISEKEFMTQVIAYAKLRGWMVYHTYDSRRCAIGFPDLVCVRGDRILVAELKSAKGQLNRAQGAWLAALLAAGVRSYVWRPGDFAEIVRILS